MINAAVYIHIEEDRKERWVHEVFSVPVGEALGPFFIFTLFFLFFIQWVSFPLRTDHLSLFQVKTFCQGEDCACNVIQSLKCFFFNYIPK